MGIKNVVCYYVSTGEAIKCIWVSLIDIVRRNRSRELTQLLSHACTPQNVQRINVTSVSILSQSNVARL